LTLNNYGEGGGGCFPTVKSFMYPLDVSLCGPTDGADGVVKRKISAINAVFMAVRLKKKLLGCDAL